MVAAEDQDNHVCACRHFRGPLGAGANRSDHVCRRQHRQGLHSSIDRRRHPRRRGIRWRTRLADRGGDRRVDSHSCWLATQLHAGLTRLAGRRAGSDSHYRSRRARTNQPDRRESVVRFWLKIFSRPWIWSYLGALLVWLAAIAFTHGYGAGGMLTAGLALAVFSVITGVAQMFVITLGPGNVDLSLPANIGLASAVAMKVMGGSDSMIAAGVIAAVACGAAIGIFNYLLIWLLRIPPIISTLSASFIIQSVGISYGRGLQIKPPPGYAAFTSAQVVGIPFLAIGTALFTLGVGVILHRTIFGRS